LWVFLLAVTARRDQLLYGRMSAGEAVGALRKIEGLVRRDVYEAAMEDLERMSGKEGER
jgi:hypothetical protein